MSVKRNMKPMSVMAVAATIGLGSGRGAQAQCTPLWTCPPPTGQLDGAVTALGSFGGALIAGGWFTHASGQTATRIAQWNGASWEPLGAGVNAPPLAFQEFEGRLIVGGDFSAAGGQPVGHVASWDGGLWSPLGAGLAGGVNDLITYDGLLIAGTGTTSMPTGGYPGWIARWDGASWGPIGSGVDFRVSSLAIHQGALIAGGGKTVGLHGVAQIARWDGFVWSALGQLPSGATTIWLTALTIHEGQLIAGMLNTPAPCYRWTGAAWEALGVTPASWFGVASLGAYRGEMIAGGDVLPGAGVQAVVKWTGGAWQPLGAPPSASVNALMVHSDRLVAGGAFSTVGGTPSAWWARWGCPCYPDCNDDNALTVADFGCFQTQFVLAHSYADCNSDNALTVADFGCFQTKFVVGCP